MKFQSLVLSATVLSLASASVFAGNAFYGDAPDANHPWAVHDQNRPQPPRVEPAAKVGDAPSDAVVLFDGTAESFQRNWQHVKAKDKRVSGRIHSVKKERIYSNSESCVFLELRCQFGSGGIVSVGIFPE